MAANESFSVLVHSKRSVMASKNTEGIETLLKSARILRRVLDTRGKNFRLQWTNSG